MNLIIDDKSYLQLRNWARDYIDKNCIYRGSPIPGKTKGTTYTWQFYLRNGLYNFNFLSTICKMFIYKIKKEIGHFDFQIAGLETGSAPILAGIPLISYAEGYEINAFSVRKERKHYGLMNFIEGIPDKKPVMYVDDFCNTLQSMCAAFDIVKKYNLQIFDYAFCIVNNVNKNILSKKFLPPNFKMIYLFNVDEFALDRYYVSQKIWQEKFQLKANDG